jgi:hypothetical protein
MNCNGVLFFNATDKIHGIELWKVDADLAPPSVIAADLEWEVAPAVRLAFSEPLDPSTVTAADLTIINLTTAGQFAAQNVTLDQNATIASFVLPTNLASGNYRFVLGPGTVSDRAGNVLSTGFTFEGNDAFFLSADANRDRSVDTVDFNILAANFSQSGKTFSQGDFNYDGTVDTIDFNLLASNFGKTLAAASATATRTPAMPFATAKILQGPEENLISLLDAPLADV